MIISGAVISGAIIVSPTQVPSCDIEGDLELQTGLVDLEVGSCEEDLNE
jgi:hypothetical protein